MEQLKAVVYCRKNTQKELNLQYEELRTFAEMNGYHIVRTITEFGGFRRYDMANFTDYGTIPRV